MGELVKKSSTPSVLLRFAMILLGGTLIRNVIFKENTRTFLVIFNE